MEERKVTGKKTFKKKKNHPKRFLHLKSPLGADWSHVAERGTVAKAKAWRGWLQGAAETAERPGGIRAPQTAASPEGSTAALGQQRMLLAMGISCWHQGCRAEPSCSHREWGGWRSTVGPPALQLNLPQNLLKRKGEENTDSQCAAEVPHPQGSTRGTGGVGNLSPPAWGQGCCWATTF